MTGIPNRLEQVRRVGGTLPGRRSQDLPEHRPAAVASTVPAWAADGDGDGGIVLDVDGIQLAELTPEDFPEKAALFGSGSEAVGNAAEGARAHTGRRAAVVSDHAYRGRTDPAPAMTAMVQPYEQGVGPYAGRSAACPCPGRSATPTAGPAAPPGTSCACCPRR